jgi:choline dehydrogenase-like flavoprotein
MICNGATLDDGGTTQVEIAIVGAGPVGVALAVHLSGRIGRIALIEAGGALFKPEDNLAFFKGEQIDDDRHPPIELYRRRMLGGTTSVWGGRCIPFDPEDFAPARGRPGWPITFEEFAALIPHTLKFLDAGVADFSETALRSGVTLPALARQPGDLVLDRIERYSKPTDSWRKWRKALASSLDIIVIYGAACTRVLTNAEGSRVAAVQLKTVSKRRHMIAANTIVLACGGLETPRLLLTSRDSRSCGLGNERDLVGRFYMTHLVSSAINVGALRFATPETARAFDYGKTFDGIYGRRMILLSSEVRQREGLPNIAFRPSRPPIDEAAHRDPVLSAMYLIRSLFIPKEYARSMTAKLDRLPERGWGAHGANVVRGCPELVFFGADWTRRRILARRKLPSVFLYREDGIYPLEFNAEHLPNPDSRVVLGSTTDPLDMPRLVVKWRFNETEVEAICRAYDVLARAVFDSGIGTVYLESDPRGSVERAIVPQGGHHIGTVRMGADASTGVVDPYGEVWSTRGLFVAGTAILPTSGFANPTLTAVALALRLADRLVAKQSQTCGVASGRRQVDNSEKQTRLNLA